MNMGELIVMVLIQLVNFNCLVNTLKLFKMMNKKKAIHRILVLIHINYFLNIWTSHKKNQ